jgi:hypothetical protein
MLNASLGLVGLLILPLMTWLMVPALVCLVAFCIAVLPLLPLLLISRRRAPSVETGPQRGMPAQPPVGTGSHAPERRAA